MLIIGGTRLTGPYTVRALASRGHDVTIFHRGQTETELPSSVHHLHGEREKLPDFTAAMRTIEPDVVLDMMLRSEFEARTLMDVFDGYAGRVVAPSSLDVYRNYSLLRKQESGQPTLERLTEDAPLRERYYPYRDDAPDENHYLYGYDKILVERAISSRLNLPATILRLPFVYGPGDRQHRLYPYVKRMADNRPVIVMDEAQLDARWTRGYVENVSAAIVAAVLDDRAAGRIYNVGESQALPEAEWVRRIGKVMGWDGEIIGLPTEQLPKHLQEDYDLTCHLDADTSRIREELDYREVVSFEEGLKRAVAWETDQPPENVKVEDYDYAAEDAAVEKALES